MNVQVLRVSGDSVCCIMKLDKVAKEIPHFCNNKFLIIAKGH